MKPENCYIKSLKIKNYRSLKDISLENITPFTVFLGKNGSGKSTILDSINFLSDLIKNGCKNTFTKRGGVTEILSKDNAKYLLIDLELYDDLKEKSLRYRIKISIDKNLPIVEEEQLFIGNAEEPFLMFKKGKGYIGSLERDNDIQYEELFSTDVLALSVFGQINRFPSANILFNYLTNTEIYDLQIEKLRQDTNYNFGLNMTKYGENLANVLNDLKERNIDIYDAIINKLKIQIPSLHSIKIKHDSVRNTNQIFMIDRGFKEPISKNYMSNGTLKMLAYYLLLMQPRTITCMGLEEPENYIHPSFIYDLADICREASEYGQIIVSTHSPYFLDSMKPSEVWICRRNKNGVTVCENASIDQRLVTYINSGAKLGHLWTEGYIED